MTEVGSGKFKGSGNELYLGPGLEKRQEIVVQYLDIIEFLDGVLDFQIFGGSSEGKENEFSDTDIKIVIDDDISPDSIYNMSKTKLEKLLGKKVPAIQFYRTDNRTGDDRYFMLPDGIGILHIHIDFEKGSKKKAKDLIHVIDYSEKLHPRIANNFLKSMVRTFRLYSKLTRAELGDSQAAWEARSIFESIRDHNTIPLLHDFIYKKKNKLVNAKKFPIQKLETDFIDFKDDFGNFFPTMDISTLESALESTFSILEKILKMHNNEFETLSQYTNLLSQYREKIKSRTH